MIVYRVENMMDRLGPYHSKLKSPTEFKGQSTTLYNVLNYIGRFTDLYIDNWTRFPTHPNILIDGVVRRGRCVSDDVKEVMFGFSTPTLLLSYFFLDDLKVILDKLSFHVVAYEIPDEYVTEYKRQVTFMRDYTTKLVSRTKFSTFVAEHKKYNFTIDVGCITCLPEVIEQVLLYDDVNFDLSDLSKADFELYRDIYARQDEITIDFFA